LEAAIAERLRQLLDCSLLLLRSRCGTRGQHEIEVNLRITRSGVYQSLAGSSGKGWHFGANHVTTIRRQMQRITAVDPG
jgi:hypothetical protein